MFDSSAWGGEKVSHITEEKDFWHSAWQASSRISAIYKLGDACAGVGEIELLKKKIAGGVEAISSVQIFLTLFLCTSLFFRESIFEGEKYLKVLKEFSSFFFNQPSLLASPYVG